jgi:uncharacterized protein (DUF433 family)
LGHGLYTPFEAAMYARLQTRTLKRWLVGGRSGDRVVTTEFDESDRVSFLDFVQALAIRNIRLQHAVPLPKIRQAVLHATGRYELEYPFARRHTAYLAGSEIVIRIPGENEDFVQVSGKQPHQRVMEKIVAPYLDDLGFDASGLANHYTAFEYRSGRIVMDPAIRLGEPFVADCGYTARPIWEAVIAEGGIEEAAAALGTEPRYAALAWRYYDFLNARTEAA